MTFLIWYLHVCISLTLNDVGDHESSAGVITDETSAGKVTFNLQGKQIPRERQIERDRFRVTWEKEREGKVRK